MAPGEFTQRDDELIRCAFLAQKDPESFKLDTEKFAQLGGFANAHSAYNSWLPLKKKLLAMGGGQAGSSITPKKGRRSRKSKAANDDDDEDGDDASPVVATKSRGRKRKADKEDMSEGDGEGGEKAAAPAKKKRVRKAVGGPKTPTKASMKGKDASTMEDMGLSPLAANEEEDQTTIRDEEETEDDAIFAKYRSPTVEDA